MNTDEAARRAVEYNVHDCAGPTLPHNAIAAAYADELAAETFGPLEDYGWPFGAAGSNGERPSNDNVPVARQPARKGDWMQLYSGKQFWPMDPRAQDVEIIDIAHSLSMQCRFAGHCLRYYSVAEHSVHLARYLRGLGYDADTCLWALLHDASEAYLVDVPRPVKPFLDGYKEAERRVMMCVCARFGLPYEMPAIVHEVDGGIIADERANMAPCVAEWAPTGEPLGVCLEYWSPDVAEIYFLDMFRKLMALRGPVAGTGAENMRVAA